MEGLYLNICLAMWAYNLFSHDGTCVRPRFQTHATILQEYFASCVVTRKRAVLRDPKRELRDNCPVVNMFKHALHVLDIFKLVEYRCNLSQHLHLVTNAQFTCISHRYNTFRTI